MLNIEQRIRKQMSNETTQIRKLNKLNAIMTKLMYQNDRFLKLSSTNVKLYQSLDRLLVDVLNSG